MFSPSNKNSNPAGIDGSALKGFIHTMQDDLNPSAQQQKPSARPAQSNPFAGNKNAASSSGLSSTSPFLNDAPEKPSQTPTKTAPITSPQQPVVPQQKNALPPQAPLKKKSSSITTVLIVLIVILMLSAIGAGGYYAWKNNLFSTKGTPVDENEEIAPENETIPPEEEQITITPISEKYSSEKPNFLSINIETSSPEDIKRVISDTANELSGLQSKSPFEFIITDSNNNPIAFPIFSIASNLNLSSELLINLEEQFSFYIHNDQGGPRIVMAIEIKNGKEVSAEMLREEPTLLDTLSFLFLPEKPTTTKTTFQSSVYDGIDIRFVNFNADGSLSIDYTIYDNKLIIATSKSSMRSVIDKILQQKAAFSNTTPTEEVSTPAVIPPSPTTDIAVPDPMASIIPSESDTQKTTENALLPPSPAENSL